MSNFSKSDLKPGMWVILKNGKQGLLVPTGLNAYTRLSVVTEDDILSNNATLCCKELERDYPKSSSWSIVKVYTIAPHNGSKFMSIGDRELLWEYDNCKEMTISEIEEILGYPIKIVKEN